MPPLSHVLAVYPLFLRALCYSPARCGGGRGVLSLTTGCPAPRAGAREQVGSICGGLGEGVRGRERTQAPRGNASCWGVSVSLRGDHRPPM